MAGKLFRFSLQALTPALRDNSNFLLIDIRTTEFSIFGKVQEVSALLRVPRMFAGANWRFNEKRNATAGGVIPRC